MESEQKESKVSSSPGSSSVATARAKCPLEKSTQGCTRLVPQSPGLLFSGLGGGVGVGGSALDLSANQRSDRASVAS